MPTVTRKGVFETNSSSTHSITIVPGDYVPDKIPMAGDVCVVYTGEFGWERETYHDAATKASYALTHAKSVNPDYGQGLLEMLTGVLLAGTGAACVKFRGGGGGEGIDHQSNGTASEAFASAESLRDFIFNPASVLETDNDNH